eukprot:Skav203851  [mRNA]  locus=scaffold3841:57333:59009:+ [translate_table: standard]
MEVDFAFRCESSAQVLIHGPLKNLLVLLQLRMAELSLEGVVAAYTSTSPRVTSASAAPDMNVRLREVLATRCYGHQGGA